MERVSKSEIQAVKDRLTSYRDCEKEIVNRTEELERLKSQLEGLGYTISDMPRSPSPQMDHMSDKLSIKSEIEADIAADVQKLKEERKAIEDIIKKVNSPDERAVIRYRYFHGMQWADVNVSLFGGKPDFLEKESSYLRRTTMLHGSALCGIAVYMRNHPEH